MNKTNVQRQADYRTRYIKSLDGEFEQLNMTIHITAKRKLERLASCYGVTQRAMLDRLLANAEQEALEVLSGSDQTRYYDKAVNGQGTISE